MDIQELLKLTVSSNASDLHLMPELSPVLRIDGALVPLSQIPTLSPESIQTMIESVMTQEQRELLSENKEIDFSLGLQSSLSPESLSGLPPW